MIDPASTKYVSSQRYTTECMNKLHLWSTVILPAGAGVVPYQCRTSELLSVLNRSKHDITSFCTNSYVLAGFNPTCQYSVAK